MTKAEDVRRIVAEAVDAQGAIDVLVNNAGVCYHRPTLEVSDEEFDEVFDVNVSGLWKMCRAVAPHMINAGRGSIVNVGPISAMIVNRPQWQPAYNALKAAVHQMAPVDEPRFRQDWIDDAPATPRRS